MLQGLSGSEKGGGGHSRGLHLYHYLSMKVLLNKNKSYLGKLWNLPTKYSLSHTPLASGEFLRQVRRMGKIPRWQQRNNCVLPSAQIFSVSGYK